MSIKLKIDAGFWGKPNSDPVTVAVTGNTVGECLDQFMSQEPSLRNTLLNENGNPKVTTYIFVNQEAVFVRQLQRTVKDGDEIGLVKALGSC